MQGVEFPVLSQGVNKFHSVVTVACVWNTSSHYKPILTPNTSLCSWDSFLGDLISKSFWRSSSFANFQAMEP